MAGTPSPPLCLALCLHRMALKADNLGPQSHSNSSHRVAGDWDPHIVGAYWSWSDTQMRVADRAGKGAEQPVQFELQK